MLVQVLATPPFWPKTVTNTFLAESKQHKLKRKGCKLVWLNPLLGARDYTPSARSMAAALPHVDRFAPAHDLASLAALGRELAHA